MSIQWSNKGAYVWKVVDSKAVKGMVEIVQRNSDGVLVKGDVKPGDAVVTQGVLQLNDNMTVRLLDQVAAGQGQGSQAGAPATPAKDGQGAGQPPASQEQPAQGGQGGYKKRQGGQPAASQASSQPANG